MSNYYENIGFDGIQSKANEIANTANSVTKGRVRTQAITLRAKKSILEFPVYVTESISVEVAQIMSQMLERVYASLTQTVLSQYPVIDADKVNNLEFLKDYHTNINESAQIGQVPNPYYTPIDELDAIMQESIYTKKFMSNSVVFESRAIVPSEELIVEHARTQNDLFHGIPFLEADVAYTKNTKSETSSDTDAEDVPRNITEDLLAAAKERMIEDIRSKAKDDDEADAKEREFLTQPDSELEDKLFAYINAASGTSKPFSYPWRGQHRSVKAVDVDGNLKLMFVKGPRTTKTTQTMPVDTPKLLKDTEVRKINAMVPWALEASFHVRDGTNGSGQVKYILGIKSNLHLIKVSSMEDELQEIVAGGQKRLQKIKFKSGEINFMDYILNLKSVKKDAYKFANADKRWISTLKSYGQYNGLEGTLLGGVNKFLTDKSVPIPNGSIILTEMDVTSLKDKTGIDLSNMNTMKTFCTNLFIITAVIISDSSFKIWQQGDNTWSVQSIASIDAELSKTDNSQIMKELNRMVNR